MTSPSAAELREPPMPVARRREIADLLRRDGTVTVAALERAYGVSSMTARRDLAELERMGLAQRTHGGAVAPRLAGHEDSFERRVALDPARKRALAEAALALVAPHETVFVDCSSTAWHAARAIVEARLPVTIVTNAMPVMELVASAEAATVQLVGVGGSLRPLARSFVGPHAVRVVREHYVDKVLLSVKGVLPDGTLTDPDPLEAEVKRAMIEQSEEAIVLLDAAKLRTRGLAAIARADERTQLLVAGADEAELAPLRAAGASVQRVEDEDGR